MCVGVREEHCSKVLIAQRSHSCVGESILYAKEKQSSVPQIGVQLLSSQIKASKRIYVRM